MPHVQDRSKQFTVEFGDKANENNVIPMPPIFDDENGRIFVSIPSYRDEQRCAKTIDALYSNAKDPEKIFVGVVEQNKARQKSCLQLYCDKYGASVGPAIKDFDSTPDREECPYYYNIRILAIYDNAAKGPAFARSLHRKLLGDEEFCLQIDAHSDFTMHWDSVVKEQWLMSENEYAIISTKPPPIQNKEDYEIGGEKFTQVPRLCHVGYHPEGVPWFNMKEEAIAHELEKPLLTTAWSAAFSFAKCHLEESAPYDPFAPLIFDLEEFPRFARFWTRGYDVYTPTRNIVYHDYHPVDKVDPRGYPRHEPTRKAATKRVKTILQIKGGKETEIDQANLGLYGLGERRSLADLETFIGIDMSTRSVTSNSECGAKKWIPYDLSMSPLENLFDHANDLDPQPEYPLRKNVLAPLQKAEVAKIIEELHPDIETWKKIHIANEKEMEDSLSSPPTLFVIILWFTGLLFWRSIFVERKKKNHLRKKKILKSARLGVKNV